MASDADRRAAFSARAPADGSWQFFDAYTAPHPDLILDPDRVSRRIGRTLGRGEIGCYSSHYALWRQLLDDRQCDRYIVLEDDVIADWGFLASLSVTTEPMPDYVRLYYQRPTRFREVKRRFVHDAQSLVEIYGFAFGTQGYVISKSGAARLLAALKVVHGPIDNMMDEVWVHGIRNYSVFPFPIIEASMPSGIAASRFRKARAAGLGARLAQKAPYYFELLRFLGRRRRARSGK